MHHVEQGNPFYIFHCPRAAFTLADIGGTPFGDESERSSVFSALIQPGVVVIATIDTNNDVEQLAPDTYVRCISTGYYLLGCWHRRLDGNGSYLFYPDVTEFRPEMILTGSDMVMFTRRHQKFNDKSIPYHRIYQLYCVFDAANLR
ncbi:MAG: hypothetical protein PHE48_00495 [Candidatus Daviesbacteria bacterium]|nr:hypothetical protein [Candidatus Daviesbacteria bacterium]